ncbi:MAG: hypothetical protein EBT21_05630, partial [Actinobacteria bacterium]|nr:hypothetical protein [Actinomycetota bacterium]
MTSGAALELSGTLTAFAEPLTLSGSGVGSNGALRVTSGTTTMSGAVTLGDATEIQIETGATLTSSSSISGAYNVTVESIGTSTLSGVIGTSTGTLTKTGTGQLTISGASPNTYTGATSISEGTLVVGKASALGTSAGGATVSAGATLQVGTYTVGDALTISGTGVSNAGAVNFSGDGTFSSTVALAGHSTIQVGGSSSATIQGAVSGAFNFTKSGSGMLTLSATNTYSGDTTIANSGGTLTVSGVLGSGSYSGAISLGSSSTLSIASASNQTLSGIISGTGQVSKSAAGTLTLSATNTYEGATTILNGTISISSDRNLGAVPASFTAAAISINGGTLSVSESLTLDTARGITLGTSDATLTVASGKTLTAASVIAGLSGADLTKSGTGTLVMSATNTYVGTTTVSQGIIDVGNASGLGGSASNQGTTVSANAGVLVANSGGLTIAEPLTISGTGPSLDGALRSGTGANTWSGAITLAADAEIQVDDQISWVSTLTLSGGVSGAFKLTLETVGNGASTISGAIATGTGSLEKTGTGTLTLSAANSYTGVTQISAGVVMLSGSGRLADTTAVTVDSLATFDLNDITDT